MTAQVAGNMRASYRHAAHFARGVRVAITDATRSDHQRRIRDSVPREINAMLEIPV